MRPTETPEQQDLRAMIGALLHQHWSTADVRGGRVAAAPGTALAPPGATAPGTAPAVGGVAGFDRLWRALADNGLFGLAVPDDLGGQGAGLFELGILFAEGGRTLCPTVVYSTLLFGLAIDRWAGDEHRRRLLPRLAAGELVGALSCWNPSDAGDVRPDLVAERVGAGWQLDGRLDFVSNADRADLMLVTAQAREQGRPARIVALLVPPTEAGVSTEPLHTIAGDPLHRVRLRGVRLADDAVLGEPGDDDLRWFAQAALALQCSEMVGGTEAVLARTVEHVSVREQFGRPIGSFQAVQHQIADLRIGLDGARLATAHALALLATGRPAPRETAVAKLHCSRTYQRATLTAHQLHGGMGYVRETDLHLWSERAKVAGTAGGSADVAAGWLADQLGQVR